MRRQYGYLCVVLSVALFSVVLFVLANKATGVQAQTQTISTPEHSLALTSTTNFTVHLPLVQRPVSRPACASPQIDEFNDPESGWPTGWPYSGIQTDYASGKYFVEYVSPGASSYSFSNGWQASDFYLEVEARMVISGDSTNSRYGLIFGEKPGAFEFYNFTINPNQGGYALIRWDLDPNNVETLVAGTSESLREGSATNRLAVRREASQIELWINGTFITKTHDSMFIGERQLGISTIGSSGLEVHFDNFYLCAH